MNRLVITAAISLLGLSACAPTQSLERRVVYRTSRPVTVIDRTQEVSKAQLVWRGSQRAILIDRAPDLSSPPVPAPGFVALPTGGDALAAVGTPEPPSGASPAGEAAPTAPAQVRLVCPGGVVTLSARVPGDPCEGISGRIAVRGDRLEIPDRIEFETNSAVIRRTSRAILDEVASVLRAHDGIRLLTIEGHTDSAGSATWNRKLSQKRADAVRRHLVGQGVEGDRLAAAGWGEDRPVRSNTTAAGRAANRRVEFRITEAEGLPEVRVRHASAAGLNR